MQIPPLGTIVCPVDLTEVSRGALYTAAGLAHAPGSRLIVLFVDPDTNTGDDAVVSRRIELFEFVRTTVPAGFAYNERTELIVGSGPVAREILATAREHQAALLVMGTHGRSALGRTLLGSTATEVLREAKVPVVTVPPNPPQIVWLDETRTEPYLGVVLVPVNLEEASESQLSWAARLSAASSHHLLMLHVVSPGGDAGLAREQMAALARSVESARGYKLLVREGNVVDEVAHVIQHDGIAFAVMGRSFETPGKLAYEVLRRTNAIVMMVP